MDKHKLFPDCPNRENDKIHTTKLAHQQTTTLLTPESVYIAKRDPTEPIGRATINNILTSLQSLPAVSFENSQLDELYLLQHREIRELAAKLEAQHALLKGILQKVSPDAAFHLDDLLTGSIRLGEKIGEFNDLIDALQPMRNDKQYRKDRQAGANAKKDRYQQPLKDLIGDITPLLDDEPRFQSINNKILAEAIYELVLTRRQDCLSASTLKKYLTSCRAKASSGRPSKTCPTKTELLEWLKTHFAGKVDEYFINR